MIKIEGPVDRGRQSEEETDSICLCACLHVYARMFVCVHVGVRACVCVCVHVGVRVCVSVGVAV